MSDDQSRPVWDQLDGRELDRRTLLKLMGLGGAAVLGGPRLFGATDALGATAPADLGSILKLKGLPAATLGTGKKWTIGATLSFSGPGAGSAAVEKRGIDLAVRHIKAAGGPTISVVYQDNTTGGDPTAAQNANTKLKDRGVGIKMSDFADGLGAGIPSSIANKILTLDAAAGTGLVGQKLPFYWGPRARTPFEGMPGLLKYAKAANPSAKTVGIVSNDAGPANAANQPYFLNLIRQAGLSHNGLYELVPFGAQDMSAVITKIRANTPDVLLLDLHFDGPGTFVRQATIGGVRSLILGTDTSPAAIAASQGTFNSAGYIYGGDFAPELQRNPLARFFVEKYRQVYKTVPDDQAARYYQTTLMIWDLYRRVSAKKGNVNSGEALQEALIADPKFKSLWGGSRVKVANFFLDTTLHSVQRYPCGIYQYKGGKNIQLAGWTALDASDFKVFRKAA